MNILWKELVVGIPYQVLMHPARGKGKPKGFDYDCFLERSGTRFYLEIPDKPLEKAFKSIPQHKRYTTDPKTIYRMTFKKVTRASIDILDIVTITREELGMPTETYILENRKVYKEEAIPIVHKNNEVKPMVGNQWTKGKRKGIYITNELHERLLKLGNKGDSFEDVIRGLVESREGKDEEIL